MICIIDYGVGNIKSVQNAFDRLGYENKLSCQKEDIDACSHIILPGVGAFRDAIANLQKSGLVDCLKENVQNGKPLLGICLGMQLLFTKSYEDGVYDGLDFIQGEIVPFQLQDAEKKVPHMGWNELVCHREDPICRGVVEGEQVYFVHSYYAQMANDADLIYSAEYEIDVPAVVNHGNVYGMQFHPEKSSQTGEQLLKNFVELIK